MDTAAAISAHIQPDPDEAELLAALDYPTSQGAQQVVLHMADGSQQVAFTFYPDEVQFNAEEFTGKTLAEARALHHERDLQWLRSDDHTPVGPDT